MIIDRQWLESKGACEEGKEWFLRENKLELIDGVKNLFAKDHFSWANWLLTKAFTHKQNLLFAIYCAEKVLNLFENKYPNDKRPRKAIQAAKALAKNPIQKNKKSAAANTANAAHAANVAAAYAADAAAYAAAAYAADAAAAYAAADAAYAAADAAYAAYDATYAADAAADAARVQVKIQKLIISFGIKLYLRGDK